MEQQYFNKIHDSAKDMLAKVMARNISTDGMTDEEKKFFNRKNEEARALVSKIDFSGDNTALLTQISHLNAELTAYMSNKAKTK